TYDWQPPPGGGQGTASVTGLCGNTTYALTVTDANGCDSTVTFSVLSFQPILPNEIVQATTCAGRCDGSIELAPSGGNGPYVINWNPVPGNGQGSLIATDLCVGSYQATITDADGCDTVLVVAINAPPPANVTSTVQQVTCNGACNGRIDVVATGGSGTFNYIWSPVPPVGQGTPNVSGLCAGTWNLRLGGPNGCDTTVTFIVTQPPALTATADVAASHCTVCDGSVFVHVRGGTPGYTFNWGAPLNLVTTDSLVIDLCAGVYPLTVTDANGCSVNLSYAVSDATGEVLTMTDGTTSCPNTCDGTASVAFNCSVPTCTIAWYDAIGTDLGQSGNTATGLCAGLYVAQVTNGDNCVSIDTAMVVAPPAITTGISSTPVSCAGQCDGTATVGITGGTGPFVITWTPPPGAGQGTPQATGLCAGPYDIHISDAIGCDTIYSVLILDAPPINVASTITDISCPGQCDGAIDLTVSGGSGTFTYLWNPPPPSGQGTPNVSSLCPGAYAVSITDVNGCDTTLTFTLTDPTPITLAPSTTPSHCAACDGTITLNVTGGTGTVDVTWTDASGTTVGTGTTLSNLCAGLYTAQAQDANGCTASVVVAITDQNGETLTMIDGQTLCATACNAQVSVTFACTIGPCSITWYDTGANIIAQNVFTVTDLCVGEYIVEVVNGAGCTTIDTAAVTPSNAIVPNLSTTPASCAGVCDGTATVGPVGGIGPYTYDWSPDPITGDGTPQATGLCAGVYSVAIADASGCDTTVSVLILGPPALQITEQLQMVT
ncbi:MAG TPA: SprB repeat-containing protein, partial [Flavobacteriales bacterium]|nr:SprB repeat-containing protein [Flavobacteriales bacterium]